MVGGEGGGRPVKWTRNTCQKRRMAQKGDLEKNNRAKMTKQEQQSDEQTSAVILQQAYKRENPLLQQSALPIVLDSSAQLKIF